jgi:hypothetical protein
MHRNRAVTGRTHRLSGACGGILGALIVTRISLSRRRQLLAGWPRFPTIPPRESLGDRRGTARADYGFLYHFRERVTQSVVDFLGVLIG